MTTIEMKGELSVQNADDLKKILVSALQKKGDILLDFSALEDIDVSTVQLIYSFYSSCKDHKLTAKGPFSPRVKQRLFTCGIIPDANLGDEEVIKATEEKMRTAHE